MQMEDLARCLRSLGTVAHTAEHVVVVELGDGGPMLVALESEAHGEDWLELRLWVTGQAVLPAEVALERNAHLSYGAFCVVGGELYLRAAMPQVSVDERTLSRAVRGLIAEAALIASLDLPAAAAETCFGYLA